METKLEQIAAKAVKQRPKSVVREIRTSRSVGTGGGRPPPVTRWAPSNGCPYRNREMTTIFEPSFFRFLENCSRSSRRDRWSGTASPPLASGGSVQGRVGQRQHAVEFGQGEHGFGGHRVGDRVAVGGEHAAFERRAILARSMRVAAGTSALRSVISR